MPSDTPGPSGTPETQQHQSKPTIVSLCVGALGLAGVAFMFLPYYEYLVGVDGRPLSFVVTGWDSPLGVVDITALMVGALAVATAPWLVRPRLVEVVGAVMSTVAVGAIVASRFVWLPDDEIWWNVRELPLDAGQTRSAGFFLVLGVAVVVAVLSWCVVGNWSPGPPAWFVAIPASTMGLVAAATSLVLLTVSFMPNRLGMGHFLHFDVTAWRSWLSMVGIIAVVLGTLGMAVAASGVLNRPGSGIAALVSLALVLLVVLAPCWPTRRTVFGLWPWTDMCFFLVVVLVVVVAGLSWRTWVLGHQSNQVPPVVNRVSTTDVVLGISALVVVLSGVPFYGAESTEFHSRGQANAWSSWLSVAGILALAIGAALVAGVPGLRTHLERRRSLVCLVGAALTTVALGLFVTSGFHWSHASASWYSQTHPAGFYLVIALTLIAAGLSWYAYVRSLRASKAPVHAPTPEPSTEVA
ncbi:MAG: hypothetical protein FWF02_11065 [Micrococcales bacterium]|nr:hypothetical protein [Micrococcales bacterium]MCL2668227.1 hypothetical protein [Micrococcales bacterium]